MRLTEQQSEFVCHYVANGGNATRAAKAAGYSEVSARQIGGRLLDKPHVQAAVREQQRRTLAGRLCSRALTVLEAILDDEDAPAGARVDAAKTILDRGGLVAQKGADTGEKALHEMSLAELEAFIRAARNSSPLCTEMLSRSGGYSSAGSWAGVPAARWFTDALPKVVDRPFGSHTCA